MSVALLECVKRCEDYMAMGNAMDRSNFPLTVATNYLRSVTMVEDTWILISNFWVYFPGSSALNGRYAVGVTMKNRIGSTETFSMRYLLDGTVIATSPTASVADLATTTLGASAVISQGRWARAQIQLMATWNGTAEVLSTTRHYLEDCPV